MNHHEAGVDVAAAIAHVATAGNGDNFEIGHVARQRREHPVSGELLVTVYKIIIKGCVFVFALICTTRLKKKEDKQKSRKVLVPWHF